MSDYAIDSRSSTPLAADGNTPAISQRKRDARKRHRFHSLTAPVRQK